MFPKHHMTESFEACCQRELPNVQITCRMVYSYCTEVHLSFCNHVHDILKVWNCRRMGRRYVAFQKWRPCCRKMFPSMSGSEWKPSSSTTEPWLPSRSCETWLPPSGPRASESAGAGCRSPKTTGKTTAPWRKVGTTVGMVILPLLLLNKNKRLKMNAF